MNPEINLREKKLVIFDLDGTLAPSKSPIEPDMMETMCRLLAAKKVDVIGGGSDKQFLEQFISHLTCGPESLKNLYIMPTSGSRLFVFDESADNGWKQVYENNLSPDEKKTILSAIEASLKDVNFILPETTYGEIIEDRLSQISFSGLGQQAPIEIKSAWDPERKIRGPIVERLKFYLPNFDVKMGGTTTIDITKKGINKAYGVRQMLEYLKMNITEAVYIGDALYENGNDAIVKITGIDTIQIDGPKHTQEIIEQILQN